MKHLLDWYNWQSSELIELLDLALKIKKQPELYQTELKGKCLLMLFEKTSTRTRISFEVAINQMGGYAIFMDQKHSQLAKTKINYEIASMSRYCDFIMARLKDNQDLELSSKVSGVPVINGCCNRYHPCQALADILTIYEHKQPLTDVKLVYVGIYNNVANSLVSIANHLKINLTLVCPIKPENIVNFNERDKALQSRILNESDDLNEALVGADFVYTDTWLDMEFFNNPEFKQIWEERKKKMMPYQLKTSNIKSEKIKIMHDMPIHSGYEIEEELVEAKNSIIYQQSENRLYAQKAILSYLNKQ